MRISKEKRSMSNKEKFFEILKDDTYGICPAPTNEKLALQVLVDYLLGEDWYIATSISQDQANTCIVDEILRKYSKQYRKDIKKLLDRYNVERQDMRKEDEGK